MTPLRCNNCLSDDLRDSHAEWWEVMCLRFAVKPVRCHHCFHRQYIAANVFAQVVKRTFERIDTGINLLDPSHAREFFDHSNEHSDRKVNR